MSSRPNKGYKIAPLFDDYPSFQENAMISLMLIIFTLVTSQTSGKDAFSQIATSAQNSVPEEMIYQQIVSNRGKERLDKAKQDHSIGWQPIESAPKDRWILISAGRLLEDNGGAEVVIARYVPETGWFVQFGGFYQGAKYWRPLPKPPKK